MRHPLDSFISRELTRHLHSKMICFRSGHRCSRLSFQKPRARFLILLPSQRRQIMTAPSTGTFSTRSLMYRQRFRNGRRRTCSLCPQRQLPQLSRTSGTLLLLGFRRPKTVVVTSWAGYDRDINHESRESSVHMGSLPSSSYLHSIFASVWGIPWQRSLCSAP